MIADFTGPWNRIKRAQDLMRQFSEKKSQWQQLMKTDIAVELAEDKLSYEVSFKLDPPPAFDEWSMLVSDTIHNLRASLDNAIWSCTSEHELSVPQKRDICFPVVLNEAEWARRSERALRTLNSDLINSIRALQPFNRTNPLRDGLILLHNLDIEDKHRIYLSVQPSLENFSTEMTVEFYDEAATARNTPPNTEFIEPTSFDTRTVFLKGSTKDPIKSIRGGANMALRVGIFVEDNFMPLDDLMSNLGPFVANIVNYIETSANSHPFPRRS